MSRPGKKVPQSDNKVVICTVGVNCTGATDAITTVAINRGASI